MTNFSISSKKKNIKKIIQFCIENEGHHLNDAMFKNGLKADLF